MRSVSCDFSFATHVRTADHSKKGQAAKLHWKTEITAGTYTSRVCTVACLAQLCWLLSELQARNGREEMVQVLRDATVVRIERGKVVLASSVAEAVASLLQLLLADECAPPLQWR